MQNAKMRCLESSNDILQVVENRVTKFDLLDKIFLHIRLLIPGAIYYAYLQSGSGHFQFSRPEGTRFDYCFGLLKHRDSWYF